MGVREGSSVSVSLVDVGDVSVGGIEAVGEGVALVCGAHADMPSSRSSPNAASRMRVQKRVRLLFIARFDINDLANLLLLRSVPPGAGDHFLQGICMFLDNLIGA